MIDATATARNAAVLKCYKGHTAADNGYQHYRGEYMPRRVSK